VQRQQTLALALLPRLVLSHHRPAFLVLQLIRRLRLEVYLVVERQCLGKPSSSRRSSSQLLRSVSSHVTNN